MKESIAIASNFATARRRAPADLDAECRRLYADPKRKHVILCCDCEGTWKQLSLLFQAIEETGIAANFFFVGDTAREHGSLVKEISTIHQSESHTMTHPNLRKLDLAAQRREILDGRAAVEDCIGRPTRGFRAPYHSYNRDTVQVLNDAGFRFDASQLYYFYPMGNLREVKPTWFREWMPLYQMLGLNPDTTFGIFRNLVRMRHVTVLPAHPQYVGQNAQMVEAFGNFLRWCRDRGVVFWSIDRWLLLRDSVEPPAWLSPRG